MTQSTIFWFSFLVSGCIVILQAVNSKEVTVEDGDLTKWFNRNIQIVRSGKNWDPTSDVHSTCGSGDEADFWMITSYFPLNATFSKVIYVDVEAEFTQCDNPNATSSSKDKQVPCYANYFEVYINRGINLPFKETSPNLNNISTVFSPLYNITSNITVGARTNKTFSFPRNNLQGVELAIRSLGACGSIFRMKMYYYYCEEHFINGVKFEKTASPAEVVKGHCTGNTIPPNNGTSLFGNCTHNGTWNVDDNVTCTCDRNYALDEGVGICLLANTTELTTTELTTTETDGSTDENGFNLMYIIIGAVAALLLILAIILSICVRRRKKKESTKDTVGCANQGGYFNQGVELPAVGQRTYINPSNYDDPQTAVQEFANELDSEMIFLERMVGGGEFGDVYKGELTTKDNKKIPIAAKTLRHDADAKSERDFNLEASLMAQFDNPNVVRMEGVVTKSIPRMIILEYMSNGSLERFLKSNDGMLTNLQLMGMARGVADGMKYLAGIQFVHRDLAARNVLLNDALLCKISDFGLSRVLEEKGSSRAEYSTKGGKIPVRWTAPEAIKYRKYTTASDVWSFGVLLWEVMTFAERPYWEWDNMKVVEQIDAGFRLPPPENCPKGVHDLMLQCWSAERRDRPSFAKIVVIIEKWIRSPETMNDDISFLSPIGQWLTSIKMARYETNFIEAGYKSTSQIIKLTNEDLKNMGISLIGHRNKITKGINSLKREKRRKSLVISVL